MERDPHIYLLRIGTVVWEAWEGQQAQACFRDAINDSIAGAHNRDIRS
jgi:hypothetical protein